MRRKEVKGNLTEEVTFELVSHAIGSGEREQPKVRTPLLQIDLINLEKLEVQGFMPWKAWTAVHPEARGWEASVFCMCYLLDPQGLLNYFRADHLASYGQGPHHIHFHFP